MSTADGTGAGGFRGSQLPLARRAWQAVLTAATVTFVLGLILLIWPGETVAVVAVLAGIALLVTGILRLVQGITASQESGVMRVTYVLIGLLAALAGLYCLRHIGVTAALLAFIVGLFWAVHGIADLVVAITGPPGGRLLVGVIGALSLLAGLITMFWPAISLTVLVAVVGIWLVCYAVLLAFFAFQIRAVTRAASG